MLQFEAQLVAGRNQDAPMITEADLQPVHRRFMLNAV
jgi:hypothetical protein